MDKPKGDMTRDESTHHALISELAKAMRTELHDNRDKGHWLESTPEALLTHAAEELGELAADVRRGESRERLFSEAADLACLAAMVADRASTKTHRMSAAAAADVVTASMTQAIADNAALEAAVDLARSIADRACDHMNDVAEVAVSAAELERNAELAKRAAQLKLRAEFQSTYGAFIKCQECGARWIDAEVMERPCACMFTSRWTCYTPPPEAP